LHRRQEEAEELCNGVFLLLYQGEWAPGRSLHGLLFTVIHRRCIDRLRRRGRFSRIQEWLSRRSHTATTPEQATLISERQRVLEHAIGALPEPHRAALLLYYGQDLSSQEVATILDATDQEIRSRLSYARKKLRNLLKEERHAL